MDINIDSSTIDNFRKAFDNVKPRIIVNANKLSVASSKNAKPVNISLTPKTITSYGYNR